MVAAGALFLVLAVAPGNAAGISGFTTPAPTMLSELRRRHRPGQSLGVTSGADRWLCRADDLDERGLVRLSVLDGPPPPTDPFPWTRIERIDIRTNRTTYGRIMGAIVGGVGGVLIPAILEGGYRTDQPDAPRNWFWGGALVGTYVGGFLGGRVVREHALYVAPDPVIAEQPRAAAPDSGQAPSADANRTTAPDPTASIAVSPPSAPATDVPATPEVERALQRLPSDNLLRIEGPFGRYHGYAARADRAGLSGLRAEPKFESVAGVRALPWGEIYRIDERSSSASRGALHGAASIGLATGVLGALLGLAVQSLGGEGSGVGAAFAGGGIGLVAGGAVGALFGSAVGAAVPSWHKVYQRP